MWLGFSLIRLRRLSLGNMVPLWVKPVRSLGRWPLYVSFGMVWKERNLLVFDNAVISVQRMKNSFVCNLNSFVCNLWSWFNSEIPLLFFKMRLLECLYETLKFFFFYCFPIFYFTFSHCNNFYSLFLFVNPERWKP